MKEIRKRTGRKGTRAEITEKRTSDRNCSCFSFCHGPARNDECPDVSDDARSDGDTCCCYCGGNVDIDNTCDGAWGG